ncbi:hypothetical protein ACH4FX_12205 [Streptomyces sp. NPDC018019]|uniref:hypothetical protein n=1 Tax=Streptomyces sp. NPDC018019 TaxID=3365030 RepID=UPI003794B935
MSEPAEPAIRQQIGMTHDGRPLYAWPESAPPVLNQPIKAHPWGAYLGGGCLVLAALAVVAFILMAILIGLSIALAVLAVALVALTTCVLVLRSVWRDYQRERY